MLKPPEEWRPGLTPRRPDRGDGQAPDRERAGREVRLQPADRDAGQRAGGRRQERRGGDHLRARPRRAAAARAGGRAGADRHPRRPRHQDADGGPTADAADQGPPRPARAIRDQGVGRPRRRRLAGRDHGRHDLRGRFAGVRPEGFDEGPAAGPTPAAGPAPRVVAERRDADRLDPAQGPEGRRDAAEGPGRHHRGGRTRRDRARQRAATGGRRGRTSEAATSPASSPRPRPPSTPRSSCPSRGATSCAGAASSSTCRRPRSGS